MVGLERYERRFADAEVDIGVLQLLEDNDWAELRLPDGARRRITDAAREAKLLEIVGGDVNARKSNGSLAERERATIEDCIDEEGDDDDNVDGDDDEVNRVPATQQFASSGLATSMARRKGHLLRGLAGKLAMDDDGEDDEDLAETTAGNLVDKTAEDANIPSDQPGVVLEEDATAEKSARPFVSANANRGFSQLESLLNELEEDEPEGDSEKAFPALDSLLNDKNSSAPDAVLEGTPAAKSPVVVCLDGDTPPAVVRNCPSTTDRRTAKVLASNTKGSLPAPVDVIEISPDIPPRAEVCSDFLCPVALSEPFDCPRIAAVRNKVSVRPDGAEAYGPPLTVFDGRVKTVTYGSVGKENAAPCGLRLSNRAQVRSRDSIVAHAHLAANTLPSPNTSRHADSENSLQAPGLLDLVDSDEGDFVVSPDRGRESPAVCDPPECTVECPFKTVADVNRWCNERRNEEIRRHRARLALIEAERERACTAAVDSSTRTPLALSVLGKRPGSAANVDLCDDDGADVFANEAVPAAGGIDDGGFLDLTQRGGMFENEIGELSRKDAVGGNSASERSSRLVEESVETAGDAAAGKLPKAKKKKEKKSAPRPPVAEDKDVVDAIRGNSTLYDKILVVEPVGLAAVMEVVKEAGFRMSIANLTSFLDRQGISYMAPPKPVLDSQREYLRQLNSQL
jgi:Slx4 endonuclease